MKRFAILIMGLGLLACGQNDEECFATVVCCEYSCLSQAEIDALRPDNCDCYGDPQPPFGQCINVEGECDFME